MVTSSTAFRSVSALATAGFGVATLNRVASGNAARQSDDASGSVLPTLMFSAYSTIALAGGAITTVSGNRALGLPIAAAGAGGLIGAFVGQNLGLRDAGYGSSDADWSVIRRAPT